MSDEMRHWTTDANGARVRRGLTVAETDELERLREADRQGLPCDGARLLELWDKHEIARIQAIGAEVQARQERKQ
jgi:hypothetical protein